MLRKAIFSWFCSIKGSINTQVINFIASHADPEHENYQNPIINMKDFLEKLQNNTAERKRLL